MKRFPKKLTILPSLTLLALAAGCSAEVSPPAPKSAAELDVTTTTVTGLPTEDASVTEKGKAPTQLVVDRYIAQVCEVPQVEFAFDSAKVRDRHEPGLEALATCFTTGALGKADLKLVGHADPRGTSTYNMALGQRRAGEVAEFLVDSGVKNERITTSSRGELEADGHNERTYADDRKVEVMIDM